MTYESYGPYQLLKKLASGGMATIFLARQAGIEGFEKLLVVKRILPHLADNEDFVKMFLDEARIAARLNHPNVVQIFNLGAQDDSYFIAMEYIHGEDVRRVFRRADAAKKPIPVPLICRIVMDAGAGLDYAHHKTDASGKSLGIVHRDVSPQNILVTFEGGVKVVDFGIAKAADQATVTKSGVLKGKYSYMSPEQAAGGKIDLRTDVFALGIVLYELLTGTRLFKRGTDLQTLEAVIEGVVTPPSQVDPRLPKELDVIVLKALAKGLDERYQTAAELRGALERYLLTNQQPSSAVQVAAFMKDIYAERLKREAEEGRVLLEELDATPVGSGAGDTVKATNAGNTAPPATDPARGGGAAIERSGSERATGDGALGDRAATDPARADAKGADKSDASHSGTERTRSMTRGDREITATMAPREPNPRHTQSVSLTQQTPRAGSLWPWLLVALLGLAGAGTGALLFTRLTQGARVNISSDPPLAAVTFDGKVVANAVTPCALPKTFAGVHSLALSRRGYVRFETTLNVPARGEMTLPPFKLEKEKKQ